MIYNSIIETIGNTPLVRLNRVNEGVPGTILVKVEYFNPGNSVKDRMAIKMIEDAEARGDIKPGGTIIEGTSGNTGMGLAMAGIAKGYKCIFTTTDKQSQEKIDALKALGAEVIVCPTNVSADDPRSYYSVARKLNEDTPNSYYPNQYDNLSNALAHYESTGPEIWRDTEGAVTHFVAGVGTGGTMCGTGKFLKEQNQNIATIGVDTYGSVFKKYKETGVFDTQEIYPYMTEGIGEDILPKNVQFDLIDEFVKVTDKASAIMTRRLAREEGLFVGWSCGSAVQGGLDYAKKHLKEDDVMVIILPDHGTRYLAKVYNDTWMQNHGFVEEGEFATAADIIRNKRKKDVINVSSNQSVAEAINMLRNESVSQLPVQDNGEYVGSISESLVLRQLIDNPELKNQPVSTIMAPPFPLVGLDSTIDVLSSLLQREEKALMVRDLDEKVYIITQSDLLVAISN